MATFTCKNCGRKYTNGTMLGNFCCKGCKLEYENKKAAKRGGSSNYKGGWLTWVIAIVIVIVILRFIVKA